MGNLVNIKRYTAAGFARLDFHVLDTKGLPAGYTGVCTAGATGVPAARMFAVKTANINIPTATVVPISGDNAPDGTFIFPNEAARGFDISAAEDDFTNRLSFQNIKTRDIGNHSFSGRDMLPFSINNLMLIGVSNISARGATIPNIGAYGGIFTTSAQLVVRGRNAFTEITAATFDGSVVLNPMNQYPWGETFQVANEGFTRSYLEDWTLAYPVTVHRWTQTAGLTDFFLGEIPASTSLLDVLVYTIDTNGIPTRQVAGVTVDVATKKLTFGVAPTAAYDIVAYYGYVPS